MKFAPRDNRSAGSARRLTLALAVAALLPLLLYASVPAWWTQRGVLIENATADDYAPVNQGQLKNIAKAAAAEMDAKLSGGAGDELHTLIESWSNPGAAVNDFAPVNIGQVKNIAKPFYDRLIAAGLAVQYPWSANSSPPDDFAVANIGQMKNLFSFRMPVIVIVSGDRQQGLPSHFLIQSLLVRIHDFVGRAAMNTSVTFTIVSGGGGLTANRFTLPTASSITLVTDANGLARADYRLGSAASVTSQIVVTIGNTSQAIAFSASTVAAAPLATQMVAAGRSHTLAVYADGSVWSWGDNSRGQLGDGSTSSRWHREKVTGLSNIVAVSAFADTSVALRSDGTVWTWGANDEYALGNGGSADSAIPAQVLTAPATPLQNIVDVAAGYSHNLALRADGTVWAWGADWGFQLGNDSENDSSFALQVLMENGAPLQNVAKIACGDGHSLALKSDGAVWAWGYNDNGALLGTGVEDWRSAVPAQVFALTNIVMIVGGETHNAALKSDGTVWTWGDNRHGQLGNGTASGERGAPGRVPGLDQVVSIAAGKDHILALKSDGKVWAWGQNGAGQVRSGCLPEKILSPTLAGDFSGVIGITAGYNQSFALTTDGLVLGWGLNFDGELGTPPAEVRMFVGPVDDFLLLDDPDHDGVATWNELQAGTDPNTYSSIGDAISNSWKIHFGFSLIDPELGARDPTGKGMTLLQDYQMGTDPTKLSTINDGIPDGWKVGHGLPVFYCELAGLDWIGKGMTVARDYQFGTNPNKISTMDDDIPDGWKVAHQVNPLDGTYGIRDDDNDGLNNSEEYSSGTEMNNPDTDGDGALDGQDGFPKDGDLHPPRLPDYNYAVIDLGEGVARAVNNNGEVVGDGAPAFYWANGIRKDLLNNGNADLAIDINDDGTALFRRAGLPTRWKNDVETPLFLIPGSVTGGGQTTRIDPNIVFSQIWGPETVGISSDNHVAGFFHWQGSVWPGGTWRAVLWTDSTDNPVFLNPLPDDNNNVLAVQYAADHNHFKDYNNNHESFDFHGSYDNTNGLDDESYIVAINRNNQVLGLTFYGQGYDAYGFPYRPAVRATAMTLWRGQVPEIVTWNGEPVTLNNDGIILGNGSFSPGSGQPRHRMLWVNVQGEWKPKALTAWDSVPWTFNPMRINRNLQVIQTNHLFQNGRLIDLNSRVPSGWSNVSAFGINEAGVIVGQATFRASPTEPAVTRAIMLLPFEVKDIKGPSTTDDVIIETQRLRQSSYSGKATAWIEPELSNGGPQMPQLEARILGTSSMVNFNAAWSFKTQYDRGNGARAGRNQPEDTVKVPSIDFVTLPTSQPWRIFTEGDWVNQISQNGFFGGEVTLTIKINGQADQSFYFRVGGKNPSNTTARAFIDSQARANEWFSYAIAKHETAEYRYNGSFYNQFTSNKKSFWRNWNIGSPTWNDDGSTLPGGYGIFQITGSVTDSEANIPRR